MKRIGKHSRWWIYYPNSTAHPMHSNGVICGTSLNGLGYEIHNVKRVLGRYSVCNRCLNVMEAQEKREQQLKHSWYRNAYKKARHSR